jgi:hypothetical protein
MHHYMIYPRKVDHRPICELYDHSDFLTYIALSLKNLLRFLPLRNNIWLFLASFEGIHG